MEMRAQRVVGFAKNENRRSIWDDVELRGHRGEFRMWSIGCATVLHFLVSLPLSLSSSMAFNPSI